MKLYFLKGSCSLATLVALHEIGVPHEAIEVDRATKRAADGKDYLQINPKGYVPALVLDNGEVLTENIAVLTYVAGLDKSGRLGPPPGTMGCYRMVEWLAYINSEVHKAFSPLFRPVSDEVKAQARELVARRLGYIEERMGDRPFLMGGHFTVADAYLFVVLSWRNRAGVDISAFPKLNAYYDRIHARPSVQKAREDEGLPH